jgi:predicted RNA binding protein with dsRBD fold (UPF0201 family)
MTEELIKSQLDFERSKVKMLEQIITHFLPEIVISDIYSNNINYLEQKPDTVTTQVIQNEEDNTEEIKQAIVYTMENVNELIDGLGKMGTTIINHIPNIIIAIDNASNDMNICEYTNFTHNNIKRFNDTLSKRSIHKKKISDALLRLFTGLELRITENIEYTKKVIIADDISKIRRLLHNTTIYNSPKYTVFSVDYTKLHNFSLSVLSLSECVERLYFNHTFKNYNLIYVPSVKSDVSDPYTFYTLTSIDEEKNIKYWELDNRLVNTTTEFINNIIPYCITLFKKIYSDIFHDNTYRQDFTTLSDISGIECNQLLKTIMILTNPKEVRKIFISIVIKMATCSLDTKKNKFNMTSDDKLFAKHINSLELDLGYIDSVLEQLFDNITRTDIDKIITEFK